MRLRHIGAITAAAIALATAGALPASAGNGNSTVIGEGAATCDALESMLA